MCCCCWQEKIIARLYIALIFEVSSQIYHKVTSKWYCLKYCCCLATRLINAVMVLSNAVVVVPSNAVMVLSNKQYLIKNLRRYGDSIVQKLYL